MPADGFCKRGANDTADATFLLALFLWDEAAGESVRLREALAAAVANQVRAWRQELPCPTLCRQLERLDGRPIPQLFIACLEREGRRVVKRPPPEDPAFASCLRIAGRAVSGALRDPTAGAVRFHRLGETPSWVIDYLPGPLIGSHLFYHVIEEVPAEVSSSTRRTPVAQPLSRRTL